MSTIHVRNVIGTGPFLLPTSGAMLDAASAQWRTILDGLADFQYESAYSMVINQPGTSIEEQVLVVETWDYEHDICKPGSTVEQLRAAIEGSLTAHTNITSFGNVDIQMWRQGAFYEQAPRIERVDRQTGTVYFADRVPPGAQIEVYKFTRHPPKSDHEGSGGYPARIGNRYRPDRMLAVGATSWTVPGSLQNLQHGRQQFKFAYRWPMPPNTPAPAPGIRGPLSPTGISTATLGERAWGSTIFIFPSPRSPKGSE
jgi:hypothetical protein